MIYVNLLKIICVLVSCHLIITNIGPVPFYSVTNKILVEKSALKQDPNLRISVLCLCF